MVPKVCSAAVLTGLFVTATAAWAQEPQTLEVKALRNPVDKSYRKMVKGMDLFERMHALAPQAALRYKLIPHKRDTDMSGIGVEIVGESFQRPVAVAPDRTFALERDARALDEDASVMADRKLQSMTWRTEVRTPGLPHGVRRLGDLRLECLVGVQADLISHYPGIVGWLASLLRTPEEFCNRDDAPYLFFAERPLFGVTLVSGERREALASGRLYAGMTLGLMPKDALPDCDCEVLLDRAYTLPLGDASWPDDTRVELEYLEGPAAAPEPTFLGATKGEVRAAFGDARAVRFESGYEVWAYDWGPAQRPPLARTEFVLLFDPSGTVTKTRQR